MILTLHEGSSAKAWLYLVLAGVFEVSFTSTLRYISNFRNLPATAGFLVSVSLSLLFLELASKTIPLGTAYAIWTGIGAAGTVGIGMIWFHEPATVLRGLLIMGIIGCAMGLKLTAGR